MPSEYKLPPENDSKSQGPWLTSCRILLAFIGFLCFFSAYSQRVGMSVAIICMVNQTAIRELRENDANEPGVASSLVNNSSSGLSVPILNGIATTTTSGDDTVQIITDPEQPLCVRHTDNSTEGSADGPFVWDKQLQGHILGAFFYGYVVSQVPAGLLAERFGGKWVYFSFLAISTAATLLTPLGATISPYFLIALRILCGIGSGGLFSSMHTILTCWSPLDERSKLAGFTYSGAWFGNIVSFPIAGLLCKYGFAGGWPSIFYIIGMFSCVMLVVWGFFIYSTPNDHPRVTIEEKDYIRESLEGILKEEAEQKRLPTPWLSILTSPAVWAIIIANITTDWGLYTFLTNIPTYLYEVLYFDIAKNGVLSALPFVGLWVIVLITPIIADKLISAKILNINWTRKTMNTIGAFGGGICTLGLAYINCTQAPLAVMTLTIGVAITGCVYCGFLVNYMDIAPRFAGTLFGLGNCIAALTGFIAPYTVASLTQNQTQEEWRRVFYISASIYIFGALVFLIFSKGHVQSWALEDQGKPAQNGSQQLEMAQPLNGRKKQDPEA